MIELDSPEAFDAARVKVEGLGCTLEMRQGKLHDVLPFGVNKGTSLGRWLVQENVSPANFLAIGQAAGDLSLFGRGWRGAVLAHGTADLKAGAARFHNVRILKHSGARGVLDALQSFGWLEMSGVG
jgi:hydroxymethylpyrimidine pyrophosphatase-like HAD family hydrolase